MGAKVMYKGGLYESIKGVGGQRTVPTEGTDNAKWKYLGSSPFKPLPAEPGKPDVPPATPTKLKVPLWSASKDYSAGDMVRVHTIGSQLDALWKATEDAPKGSAKPAVGNPSWDKVSSDALGSAKKGKGRVVGGHCPTLAHAREDVTGKGKKKRAPSSPSSGRSRRADIVKKVMAEKGLKMIDASKYVKQHGLYKA
jgi:hypothetical protein